MKLKILKESVKLAVRLGFRNVTRDQIAVALDCSTGIISYHYRTMAILQDSIVAYSIENEVLEVIAQALAERHPYTEVLTLGLKRRAAISLT